VSLNVGPPKDDLFRGSTVHARIGRQPVTRRQTVRLLNVDGDGQGDLARSGRSVQSGRTAALQAGRTIGRTANAALSESAGRSRCRRRNANELIAAGVDLGTVAGRLGHGGGGTTPLRVHAAWVSEAVQCAAESAAARLPPGRPPPRTPRQRASRPGILHLTVRERRPNRANPTGRVPGWKAILNVLAMTFGDRLNIH
jgi:hypothetical protein